MVGSNPGTVRVSCEVAPEKRCRGKRLKPVFSAQLPSLGRYVEGMVHLFYQSDEIVRGDPELQAWCWEITEVGLCHAQDRGKICLSDKGPSPDLGDRSSQSHPPFCS